MSSTRGALSLTLGRVQTGWTEPRKVVWACANSRVLDLFFNELEALLGSMFLSIEIGGRVGVRVAVFDRFLTWKLVGRG